MTREEILSIAKPILFNTDMTRAILEERKTATRRLIKCKYSNTHLEMFTNKYGTRLIEIQDDVEGETFGKNPDGTTWHKIRGYIETEYERKPYKKGQFLYVRETWFYEMHMHDITSGVPDLPSGRYLHRYVYRADSPDYPVDVGVGANGWRPSIHMPKEAARIFLRVTDVRVERLQAMTLDDFLSEGVVLRPEAYNDPENAYQQAQKIFIGIWNSTTDELIYKWDANPWVWVIEFERVIPDEAREVATDG